MSRVNARSPFQVSHLTLPPHCPSKSPVQTNPARPISLLPLVLALGGLIVVFHVRNAQLDRSFIRASHLGTALEYAKGPINLLRPVIVGFNATGSPVALEFPLWQAAAAVAFKLSGSTWYGWANLVSLILFTAGLGRFSS